MSKIELRRNKAPKLNRRSFIAGSGVAMSLPLLEAMLPEGKTAFAKSDTPSRLITVFTGNGIWMDSWTPTDEGRDFTLSPTLEPLEKVKDKTLVLTGIQNSPAWPAKHGYHGAGSGAFLTCSSVKQSRSDLRAATSMDQVIAQNTLGATRLPTLDLRNGSPGSRLALTGLGIDCDNGFSCTYLRHISWSSPTTPVPNETNPRRAFDSLFSTSGPVAGKNETLERIAFMDQSVIDTVLGDVNRLQKQLGYKDKEKLQEYLTNVRELEVKLSGTDSELCPSPKYSQVQVDRPGAWRSSYVDNGRALTDIIVLAFQCDITRIATYMLSRGLSGRIHSHLGIHSPHRTLSGHGHRPLFIKNLKLIDKFNMEETAYLCNRLNESIDVTGKSLLDSTVVYRSSEISDGAFHNADNRPIVLVGSCNGYFDVGQHIRYPSEPELGRLYLSMMDAMGVSQKKFGISTEKLFG